MSSFTFQCCQFITLYLLFGNPTPFYRNRLALIFLLFTAIIMTGNTISVIHAMHTSAYVKALVDALNGAFALFPYITVILLLNWLRGWKFFSRSTYINEVSEEEMDAETEDETPTSGPTS